MKRLVKLFPLVFALVIHFVSGQATCLAGPYADDLSKCLVHSTTDEDKKVFVQWMFAIAALHPDVQAFAVATDEQRAELNEKMGHLFERLLTQSCLTEASEALRYEGQSVIEASFSVFGQVAGRELFSHPSVVAGMAGLEEHIDLEKLVKELESRE